MRTKRLQRNLRGFLFVLIFTSACGMPVQLTSEQQPPLLVQSTGESTPLPTRGPYPPGEIFEYIAQSGDTLPAVAAHFNTTVTEIRDENPDLPSAITTFPPGFPLRIPAYYVPLTGPTFKILPDSEVVYGPTSLGFDIENTIRQFPGYLAEMESFAYKRQRKAWDVVLVVAERYSIHPRLFLSLLEYRTKALSLSNPEGDQLTYPMGTRDISYRGLFWQLVWVAERLNDGYYGWREGTLSEFTLQDGLVVRPDPWQNAGTVALQYLFAGWYATEDFEIASSPEGFVEVYRDLWGDPFRLEQALLPGSLQQPELTLPFQPNRVWDFTGGPHFSWGTSLPRGALDFAPPSEESGCVVSNEWFTAPGDGIIVRSEEATVVLDLDGDGFEQTGWVLFFFHVGTEGRIASGTVVEQGGLLGHPSCEGGRATGTHIHVARKYNGEWISASGPLAFVLDGWVAAAGTDAYEGTLTKGSKIVPACPCSRQENQILYEFP
jgi:murein DD-endopeptidase MepM/ murein hydrolase activator NlpD